jgi:hypothetical protein
MRARKGAATHLYRAAAAVLIFGLGAPSMSTVVNRGRATPHHSGDWKERPPLVAVPDREFAASNYVHQHLRADVPRDSHSDAWVANLQRQIGTHYGVVSVNIDQYSPPLYVIGGYQPTVRVRAERAWDPAWVFEPLQQQWEKVPAPDGVQPSVGTDNEAIVYQSRQVIIGSSEGWSAVVLHVENPLSKGTGHPYFGVDGILRCAKGRAEGACDADSNNRLRGFPWDKLEAVRATLREIFSRKIGA